MTLIAATVTVGPASIAGASAPEAAPVHEHAAAAIQLPTDLQKVTVKGEGFDACATPTTTQMTAFWTATPFFVNAVYIGGSVVACTPTITASWVSTVINQGWTLLPIWVGPQSPCTTFGGAKISTNTTTAYNQGYSEASAAYSKMVSLGMVGHSVVVYDMEGANNTAACTAAIDAFMSGWTT